MHLYFLTPRIRVQCGSEDLAKLGERVELDQVLAVGRGVEGGVLQHPCVFVEQENGVQARRRVRD